MANRAFFRTVYAQNQHLTNIVRRSGREAVASTDRTTKRKRTDEEFAVNQPNLYYTEPASLRAKWENGEDLVSCLFDQNDHCTIFDPDALFDSDVDEPIAPVELQLDPSLENFRLSPHKPVELQLDPSCEHFTLSPRR